MKTCNICKVELPLESFFRHPHTRDRRQSRCKTCSLEYHNTRNRTAPSNWRKYQFKKYGMTLEDYEQLVRDQDNCCAICGNSPDSTVLHVDHCHRTGKVRGLLCGNCNRGLGFFNDSPPLFEAAIRYLKKNI